MTTAEAPDVLALGARMRYAAEVLRDANVRYGYLDEYGSWSPSQLATEADQVESEDGGAYDLAVEIFAAQRAQFPNREDLKSWREAGRGIRKNCLSIAEHLILAGYHKDAS